MHELLVKEGVILPARILQIRSTCFEDPARALRRGTYPADARSACVPLASLGLPPRRAGARARPLAAPRSHPIPYPGDGSDHRSPGPC